MTKNRYQLLLLVCLVLGVGLACESFSAIRSDYTEVRATAEKLATQADKIITQAKGIATSIGEDGTLSTARAIATQQGPGLLATGQGLVTQAAQEGYLQTAEALVTHGPRDVLPTLQAVATQYLFPADPPDDIPIFSQENVSNLFTNQSAVSYFVNQELASVVSFYRSEMPESGWTDVSDENAIRDEAAVLKFFKPDRVAALTLTANPLDRQTIVLITVTQQ